MYILYAYIILHITFILFSNQVTTYELIDYFQKYLYEVFCFVIFY